MNTRRLLCRSDIVHVLKDCRNAHAVQHVQVHLQVDRQNIMLHVTADLSNVMWQGELMLAQLIRVPVFRTQRRRDEWMHQRKSTCAWSQLFQSSVELSTEAVMRSEYVLCVCLCDAGTGQRDNLSHVCRKGYEVYPQAQVSQERLRCKFQ